MTYAAPSTSREVRFATAPPGHHDEPGDKSIDAAADGARLKILIVEDEFFIALDNQAQVEDLGHTVVGIAASAEQAIRMAERDRPDVVLMDIRLNGSVDGIDAAAAIRDRYAIGSIFITANTDSGTLQRARRINPLGILEKPLVQIRLRDLLAQVSRRNA